MGSTSKKPDVEIHESLTVYNNPPNATVDIIAVPGLGANAVKSWESNSPTSSFNWITDQKTTEGRETGLAKDCPSARVLLFNYASAYQGAYKVEQYMTNIVGMFLQQLKVKREGIPRRPMVLIGHSMGGLVIAKAMVLAETQRYDYPEIYEAIAGCIFFGTPFDGAPVADIAKEWVTINERLGKAINSQLITLLQPGNEALKELKNDFVRSVNKLGQKVPVHCFWERSPTHWEDLVAKLTSQDFPRSSLGKLSLQEYRQFVSRDSATLSGMKETGIARTHRDLVRFSSDKDPEYQLVKAILREMVNAAPRISKARFNDTRRLSIDSKIYRDILDVLDGPEPKRKLKALLQRPSSESWIVKDRELTFVEWLDDDEGRRDNYLWIHGPKGKGKSTAVASIVKAIDEKIRKLEENQDQQSPHLLAYFFCEATPDYCTAEDVVKSLMRQLCHQQEILATYAVQFLKKQGEHKERPQAKMSIENLWQSLEDMLSEASVGTIFFVINNLDELEQSPSTDKLFSFIREDTERMSSSGGSEKSHRVRTKWLISSRSHKNMQNLFGSSAVRKIDLDDAKYGDQQQQALRKYAWIKAQDLQREKKYTMAMTYLAGSIIGDRADNTKWIDLASVQLDAFPPDASEIRVERMLEKVPRDFRLLLDAAWHSVLRLDDEDMDTVIEVLRCLVLTYEDPREEELLVLAGFSPHSEEGKANIHKLVEKCQPLVKTRVFEGETFVGFVYQDVKKHLLERAKELLHVDDGWVKWQHGKMSLRCLSHIMDALGQVKPRVQVTEQGQVKNAEAQNKPDLPPQKANGEESMVTSHSNSADQKSTDGSKKTLCGPRLSLAYATRYWLQHASDSTIDVAEIISREYLFWAPDSAQRQRWAEEYHDLTKAFENGETAFPTWKAMHIAAAVGFSNLVSALLKQGYRQEIFEYDVLSNRPIHLAAYFGNAEVLEELLKAGSPVDDMGQSGQDAGPLAMAAQNGQINIMRKLMLDWKANINAVDSDIGPVLNAAIISGNTDAVKLLLENGVELTYDEDLLDKMEVAPPLVMSAYFSDIKMFSAILEGANDKLTPDAIDDAMISAATGGNLDILRTLLESFEHEHEAFQGSLYAATAEANWEACLLILRHPPAQGLDCEELFQRAATGNEDLNEVLQACWGNNKSSISRSVLNDCLYEATDKEKESTVELLLQFGADANAPGREFGNALTASANDGTEGILSMLLKAGAQVNSRRGYALQQASSQGYLGVVKLLLDHGADVNRVSQIHKDRTALQAACNNGHHEVVRHLLQRGADPNLGGGPYRYPIIGAVCDGGLVLDEMLQADNRLDLDVFGGPYASTPLSTAAFCLPAERLGPLLDRGASIDMVDTDGETALMVAAGAGDADAVRVLLNRGADFLKFSNKDYTALQYARINGDSKCISLLLDRAQFILRGLHDSAERGDEHARNIILNEKKERVAAMEEEFANQKGMAEDAAQLADILKDTEVTETRTAGDDENSAKDGIVQDGTQPQESEQKADAMEPSSKLENSLEHEETGYPTPGSVTWHEDDEAESGMAELSRPATKEEDLEGEDEDQQNEEDEQDEDDQDEDSGSDDMDSEY